MATTTDRRRNNGPQHTYVPTFLPAPTDDAARHTKSASRQKGAAAAKGDASSSAGRKVYLKTGSVARCSGSAYLELTTGTKVICSVHGPRQVAVGRSGAGVSSGTAATSTSGGGAVYSPTATLAVDLRYAPFARPSRSGAGKRGGYLRTREERHLAAAVADALRPALLLHLFPKSEVAVHVCVLEEEAAAHAAITAPAGHGTTCGAGDADGADGDGAQRGLTLAAAINCAMAAVLDAGIECCDIVGAAAVGVRSARSGVREIVLDPGASTTSSDSAAVGDAEGADSATIATSGAGAVSLTMAYMPTRDEVPFVKLHGAVPSLEELDAVMEACQAQARRNALLVRQVLLDDLQAADCEPKTDGAEQKTDMTMADI